MQRIDTANNTASLPTPAALGTPGYFKAPGDLSPTTVSNDWANMVQEELISIVTAAGLTPSKTTYNQVLLAVMQLTGGWSAGDIKATYKTTADTGWVMMNDGSIGSASSAATTRANADTINLYTLLWTNVSNTYAPVSGGRGGSAAADFAANKTLTLPAALGRAMASAGAGSGLTSRALGLSLGEETHILTVPEMPAHTHSNLGIPDNQGGIAGSTDIGTASANVTGSTGGGSAHNNMQPTLFVNYMIKL